LAGSNKLRCGATGNNNVVADYFGERQYISVGERFDVAGKIHEAEPDVSRVGFKLKYGKNPNFWKGRRRLVPSTAKQT